MCSPGRISYCQICTKHYRLKAGTTAHLLGITLPYKESAGFNERSPKKYQGDSRESSQRGRREKEKIRKRKNRVKRIKIKINRRERKEYRKKRKRNRNRKKT